MTSDALIMEVSRGQEQAISVYGRDGELLTRGVARIAEDGQSVVFVKVEQPGLLVSYFFLSRRHEREARHLDE